MDISTPQWIGWTAIAGGLVALVGFISLALLFIVGEPFGTLNDVLSVPTALLMLPLILALYRLNAPHRPAVALIALLAGGLGFAGTAAGSALLVLGRIEFTQSLLPGVAGFGLIGLWLLLNTALGLTNGTLPRGLAWTGLVVAIPATLALLAVWRAGSVAGGLQAVGGQAPAGAPVHPLIYAFVALGAISYALMPLLYIALGRLFLSGRLAAVAALS